MKKHSSEGMNLAILKLLDSAYTEIAELEHRYRMQVGGNDLRVPIEYYQDAIRQLSSGVHHHGGRLSVESLASDITRLRQRAEWLLGGGHVFLDQRNYQKSQEFKRWLITVYASLDINVGSLFNELVEFARLYRPHGRDYDQLQDVLERRVAEKEYMNKDGINRFVHYPAKEFWHELEEAMRLFGDAEKSHEKTVEFRAGGKIIKKVRYAKEEKDDSKILAAVIDRLKYFWIQVTHPLMLAECIIGGVRPMFDSARFIGEDRWQEMERDAKRLSGLYHSYTVLFAALVRDTADRDFKALMDNKNALVSEAADIKQIIEQLMQDGLLETVDVEQIAGQCQSEEIKNTIAMFLHHLQQAKQKKVLKQNAAQFVGQLDDMMKDADQAISASDKAHFNFLAGQLMVYHSSQDLIKKLAAQGLNIAGKFVEQASTETSRGPRTRGGR